jgi:hypothetical protein
MLLNSEKSVVDVMIERDLQIAVPQNCKIVTLLDSS